MILGSVSAQIAGALGVAKILRLCEHRTSWKVRVWGGTAERGRRAFERLAIVLKKGFFLLVVIKK